MLREFIQTISEMQKAAADFRYLRISDEEILVNDGKTVYRQPVSLRRLHRFHNIGSFIDGVRRWNNGGSVWHDFNGIHAVYDDTVRRDSGTFGFRPNECYHFIKHLDLGKGEPKRKFESKELLQLSRTVLFGTGAQEALGQALRAFTWQSNTATVDDGQTLGNADSHQIRGDEVSKFPYVFRISTQMFDNITSPEVFDMVLNVLPTERKFTLHPTPGAISGAEARFHAHLQAHLEEEMKDVQDVGIFFGDVGLVMETTEFAKQLGE